VEALVFGQVLKEAAEGMVLFHSFPFDQAGLGTSQPRDAWAGQLVLVAPVQAGMEQGHQGPGASYSLFGSSLEVLG
jgi:hypothetical protein